jgi:hypothetical protein
MMITIIILIILLFISIFINVNLYNQVTPLENEIKRGFTHEETFLKYYEAILILIISAKTEIDRIDKKGSFSSDDEVGFAFKVIQTAINNLVLQMKSLQGEQPEEKK